MDAACREAGMAIVDDGVAVARRAGHDAAPLLVDSSVVRAGGRRILDLPVKARLDRRAFEVPPGKSRITLNHRAVARDGLALRHRQLDNQ